jgi:DNA-binding LytR/AlgR family response regulator
VLKSHIDKVDSLDLIGSFESGTDALNFLHQNDCDLMFLDIQMEDLQGFDVIRSLSSSPLVVMTTAYSEYALQGYEFVEVVDYLVKPISFARFMQSIKKVLQVSERTTSPKSEELVSKTPSRWMIRVDEAMVNLKTEQITHVQAWGNFIKVFLEDGAVHITARTMKETEESLPGPDFLRIHKSYIVNRQHVRSVKGNRVTLSIDEELPIGISYKQKLLDQLK